MRISIQSTAHLGAAIRAVRRLSRVRIDDLAATEPRGARQAREPTPKRCG
jgi:hypothetical protein